MINAQIVADSINKNGNRITTFLLTYPRIIHAELLTHRAFSRNAASSRAIPSKKMVAAIMENPFIPIAWQKEHSGMQGTEYFTDAADIEREREDWLDDRNYAIKKAEKRIARGVTKQIANRPLEPFQWYTSLVTATDFENFFELRCPQYEYKEGDITRVFRSEKDLAKIKSLHKPWTLLEKLQNNKGAAEIHLMALAECMWDAMNESKPNQLEEGNWHIPFANKIDYIALQRDLGAKSSMECDDLMIKISTGMSARTSYTVVGDEKEVKYETLIGIHDKMINQRPFHASPFEHCARAMNKAEYHLDKDGFTLGKQYEGTSRNFKGFIQYREIIENQI